jgi:hypothetical protein
MNLKETLTERIIEEIDFAIKSIEEQTENPFKQLYFFSIPPGAFVRAANFEYDRTWIFAHFVLQSAYQTVQQRFDQIAKQADRHTDLDGTLMESLNAELVKLRDHMVNGEEFTPVLERISEIAYSTTGNGNYQKARGRIR